ncbi:MAG: NFACT family protein [Oscillospiraceae bacterium]|nr:NFACT family protein [Oscillospiraceae bacterium]MBQ7130602.1 NFACT family protein [Oscillospiraceae bacterium]
MAFDAFFLSAVLDEVREKCIGARIDKIHQPSRDTLIIHMHSREHRTKLLFAANPTAPRLHLTTASPENPAEPPMFCMLLRKHLMGAKLSQITQPPMERAATFTFDCTDEMGFPVQKRLVAELMGRTCNLYLLSPEGRIIDCLRRIGLDESAKRAALPGLMYQEPEPITKRSPMSEDAFAGFFDGPGADVISDRLMDTFGGLSPLVCREAALFAAGSTDARIDPRDAEQTAQKLGIFFREHLNHPKPCCYALADGTPKQFAFCPIRQYGGYQEAESFAALLDMYYTVRDRKDAMRQKSQAVRKMVQNLCTRLTRKLAIQEKELEATYDRERLRQLGDIVTANIHKIVKGQTVVSCEDFYDEEMKVIDIPISPILSPQQNAAKFYKDYTRMKNAERELTRQIELGEQELNYLKSVLEELSRAQTDAELDEIKRELQEVGYLRVESGRRKMKQSKVPPMRFESTDGYPIYVGRNNRQNEELTFKLARKDDIWCHASKVHGSHVIISCGGTTPPDDTITQAAQLAAYYSETSGGQNIPVDVTPVKQVKKIPNGKPGMVIYHSYKTVIANPYADIVVDALNAEKKDG